MDLQNEVKQALKQLPPAERVVAFALKNIYERIKALYQKQKIQIDGNRIQFGEKYKQLEQNASSIIQGKKLTEQQLVSTDEYFVEEEKHQIKSVLESGAPLKEYWLVALKNSCIKNFLNATDEKILSSLQNIQSKVTENTIQLSLTFSSGPHVQANTYHRIIQLNNGIPVNFKGDKLKSKETLTQGFLYDFFKDTNSEDQLYTKFQYITFIINNIIPYSLRFYLGEVQDEFDEEDSEDEDDQEDEEDQQEENQKAHKKKN